MAERDYKQLVAPKSGSLNRVAGPGSSSGNALASFANEMFSKTNQALLKQRAVDGAAAGAMQPFRRNAEGQLEKPVMPEGFFSHSNFKQNERNAILTNAMSIFDGELRIGLSQLHQEIKQDSEIGHADWAANYAEQSVDRIDLAIANAPDEIKPALMAKAHEIKATHELSLSDDAYEIDKFQSLGAISAEIDASVKDALNMALNLDQGMSFQEHYDLVNTKKDAIVAQIEAVRLEFPGEISAVEAAEFQTSMQDQTNKALAHAEMLLAYRDPITGGRNAAEAVREKHVTNGSDIGVQNYLNTLLNRIDAAEDYQKGKLKTEHLAAQVQNNLRMQKDWQNLVKNEPDPNSPAFQVFFDKFYDLAKTPDPESGVHPYGLNLLSSFSATHASFVRKDSEKEANIREQTSNYVIEETK